MATSIKYVAGFVGLVGTLSALGALIPGMAEGSQAVLWTWRAGGQDAPLSTPAKVAAKNAALLTFPSLAGELKNVRLYACTKEPACCYVKSETCGTPTEYHTARNAAAEGEEVSQSFYIAISDAGQAAECSVTQGEPVSYWTRTLKNCSLTGAMNAANVAAIKTDFPLITGARVAGFVYRNRGDGIGLVVHEARDVTDNESSACQSINKRRNGGCKHVGVGQ